MLAAPPHSQGAAYSRSGSSHASNGKQGPRKSRLQQGERHLQSELVNEPPDDNRDKKNAITNIDYKIELFPQPFGGLGPGHLVRTAEFYSENVPSVITTAGASVVS